MAPPYQAKDSSQRGFVAPGPGAVFSWGDPNLGWGAGFWNGPEPKTGDPLEDFLHDVVAGVAGLDGALVRPRWQPEPPDLPNYGINWAAFGVTGFRPVGPWAWVGHDPRENGRAWMRRWEYLDILISFYGPRADYYQERFHSGLMIAQNREALFLNGFGLIEIAENVLAVPEQIKGRWTRRLDQRAVFSRVVVRSYPILNLVAGQFVVETDTGFVDIGNVPWPGQAVPQPAPGPLPVPWPLPLS